MELCVNARIMSGNRLDPAGEASLIDRCKRQDMDAFGRLIDAYQSRVHGFVRRMLPDADDALDVTQEVFIRAFQNFNRFDGRSSLRTWLFRIAHNLCIDRARKYQRTPNELRLDAGNEDESVIDVPDERWDPQMLVLDDEFRTVLEGAISSMSDKLRSVLLLHDREDMAYDEIAQTLNVPVGTVKSRLFLARAHLQKVIQSYLDSEVATQ